MIDQNADPDAATTTRPRTSTGSNAPSYDQVNSDYQTYLGRPLSQDEYSKFWAPATNYNVGMVANSTEGLAYANSQLQQKPPTPNDPGATTPPPGPTPTPTPTPTTVQTPQGPRNVGIVGNSSFLPPSADTGNNASALQQYLLGRAMGTIKDSSIANLQINPDDPIISSQVGAYNANQTREGRRYLKELAERSGPNANIGSEGRATSEKIGQSTSAYQSQLMGQELNSRRQEIMQAMHDASGFLTAQQQMDLQDELTHIDDALKLSSMNQQESQFSRQLGQNAYQFDQDLGYRYAFGG